MSQNKIQLNVLPWFRRLKPGTNKCNNAISKNNKIENRSEEIINWNELNMLLKSQRDRVEFDFCSSWEFILAIWNEICFYQGTKVAYLLT